jgi:integrase
MRSIVYGVVGPCKTESSQRPVPIHLILTEALLRWKGSARYTQPNDWVFDHKSELVKVWTIHFGRK